jgi:glycosyltransferase involved in cell wall biosynthesis
LIQVSIVTASFNRRSVIADALDSVRAQTHEAIEHIIQDGGSTDGTLEVIGRAQRQETSLVSAPDGGIYDAINKGIKRSKGDIIGLMHSDDFFADEFVVARVAEAFEDPSIDGVYGDLDYVAVEDTTRVIRRWRSGPYSMGKLRRGWMPPHPTLYLRREIFEKWGLYDTSYDIAADYDAMLRYLVKGKIELKYLPIVMVKMRVGGESNKSLKKILRKSREDYRAIRSNGIGGLPTLAMKNLSKIKQFI